MMLMLHSLLTLNKASPRVLMWLEQLLKYISMMLLAVIAVDRFRMSWRVYQYKTRKHFKLSVGLA